MAVLNFNAQEVAPNSAFDPLPAGWYHVKIVDSETKPVNPPKTGSYLALTMEVIDGTFAGRKLFPNLNLENENPIAVRIAYEQLSALCYVTGQIQCQDSQQLHGIPFQAKVSIRAASGQYDASNDVKGFRNAAGVDPKDIATGNVPAGSGAAGAPQPPTPPGAPTAPSPAPTAPAAPPAAPAPAPAHDAHAAAIADGWVQHPTSAPHGYKGELVQDWPTIEAQYPAPVAPAAPTAPAAPAAPAVPAAPAAPATDGKPPWAK